MAERKPRQIRVLATDAQQRFAKLVTEKGMTYREAASVAYPNSKDPSSAARQALKSPAVKMLILKHQAKAVRLDATACSYKTLREVCVNPEAKDADRIKSAIALHDKFGLGSVKTEDGDIFNLEDMSVEELDEFIEEAESEMNTTGESIMGQNDIAQEADVQLLEDGEEIDKIFPKIPVDSGNTSG